MTTEIQDTHVPSAVESAGKTEQVSSVGGLNSAFMMIYRICAIVAVVAFVILTLIALADVILYHIAEASQRAKLVIDPNLKLSDTTDVQAMSYVHNNADKEPYNIFLEQNIISAIYVIIGCAVAALGVQLATFFALKLYTTIRELPFKETVDVPFQFLAVLLVSFVGAVMLSMYYKSTFIKNSQPKLKALRTRLRDAKSFIYRNMITDNKFLFALKSNDIDGIIAMMKRNVRNQSALSKMMFTFNLYTYFASQIPETDTAMDQVNRMFTSEGIRTQKIDPTMLFYYKRPVFIPNLYPSLRSDIQAAIGLGERNFMREVGSIMKEVNKRLIRIQNLNEGKVTVRDYMWKVLLIALFISAILVLMLIVTLMEGMLPKIIDAITSFFAKKN